MKKALLLAIVLVGASFLFSGCSLLDFKTKAGIQVITNDVPSGVYLDNKYLDKTPYINKEIKPGEYNLEIRPDDPSLASYQTKVSLKKGLLTVLIWKPGKRPETSGGVLYEMEKLPNRKKSEIALTTIPDGAIVTLDGEAKGFAPVVEGISVGEHEYEVTLPSYETQKHTINVLEGYRMNVTLKLAKQDFTFIPTTSPTPLASDSAQLATPAASVKASPTPSPKASASATVKLSPPKVVIKKTGFIQNGKEVLRVRDSAGSSGKELGFAPVGSEYAYLKETMSGWHKINFNGTAGWVSAQYTDLIQ